MIRNPVLPGFNPDPSFLRVGEDYYIATSTFEWYPGVQIFKSKDLVNWRLVARPLNTAALLDLRGTPDSCGVWAPCLSHDGEKFWLVYTDVKRLDGAFKDAHNYITACETIDGNWCDPWHVNSLGFDPSLFHDADGSKWFLNLRWNHRGPGTGGNPADASFDGIWLQQWSPTDGLVGPLERIWDGTDRGLTEAPHIFKRNGYYYLTTAEGGTGYDHAVSMARSRSLFGPYEDHPQKHLMCAADAPDHPIQRTGHGQYVETHDGQHYHSFLMGRPISGLNGSGRFCPLGRETGIERCVWGDDDWLYLENGGVLVREELPGLTDVVPEAPARIEYRFDRLPDDFQWLRTPNPKKLFRCEGDLVLTGRESLGSWYEQSLVARRQEHHVYSAETVVIFEPDTYQQAAGLTTYYNRHKFHAVVLTHEPDRGRVLDILSCPGDWPEAALIRPIVPVPVGEGPIELRVEVNFGSQQFFWRQSSAVCRDWLKFGPQLNAAVISDEGGRGEHSSFTGAFVGMVTFDTTGLAREARFSDFSYDPT